MSLAMRISSRYTVTFGIPFNRLSITRWNMPGAEERPYGRRDTVPEQLLLSIDDDVLSGVFLQGEL